MKRHMRALGVLAVLALSLVSCSKTKTVTLTTAPPTGAMTLHLDPTVSGQALVLDGGLYTGLDGAGNDYSVTNLRFFISNVQLRNTSGMIYGVHDYHYRDAKIASTRDYTFSGIPPGTYDELSFTFGLDDQWNVSNNGISADPNVAGMEWPPNWGGGWHYMILEGMHNSAGGGTSYKTHLGRRYIAASGDPSGQGPDSVAYPHFFQVHLAFPSPITINGDQWAASVQMELNGWYQSPVFDLNSWFPTGTEGIMVNLTAESLLQQNGPHCFTISAPQQL